MIDWYHLVLFLHILGVLGLFMGVAVQLISMQGARRAQSVEAVRLWSSVLRPLGRFMLLTSLLILFAGLAMLLEAWGWSQAWLDISLVLFLLTGLVTSRVNSAHGRRLGSQLARAGAGPVSPELRQLLTHPLPWTTTITTSTLAVGIVFLMVMKPDWIGSLLTVAVAVLISAAISGLVIRQGGTGPAMTPQDQESLSASQTANRR
ncbi:hypothetical protein KTAU_38120 [Thermogemmatispora aurantia]|uniref:DUF2269 domain-containing protein n=1 Tax=Thermogemmatispora aurantia TaxID=2045279 RepID=A0A5J4KF32_9CHLR|nr:DUF2269 family protein [Thermogemmatispora aurantia]GER85177.1 hypothetical protein KTAU_38120 [Thermogemmatispora aurantia]